MILLLIIYLIFFYTNKKKEIIENKKNNTIRINGGRIKDNKEFLDILFDIEGLYHYNQQAYLDILKYTELFLEIIDIINIDNKYSTYLYKNLVDIKREILDTLISIEISLPNEYNINDVIQDFCKILDKYLYNIYEIHETYIKENGINYTMNLINLNEPYAYNFDKSIVDYKRNTYFNRF
jgi:hypothetical protein